MKKYLVLVVGLILVIGISIGLPKKLSGEFKANYKVRNISAHETNWESATAAQPGDVIEHFLLIHVPETSIQDNLIQFSIKSDFPTSSSYRDQSLKSNVLGINPENSGDYDIFFTGSKVKLKKIAKGEFIDFRWQTRFGKDITFESNKAPLLTSRITIFANDVIKNTVSSNISIFSTGDRTNSISTKRSSFKPNIIAINPKVAYDDLGTGVLIVGELLDLITDIKIRNSDKKIAWLKNSSELLEASIPEGLVPGQYVLEFIYELSKKEAYTFTVLSSKNKAVVTKATPKTVENHVSRTIVLQGVHFNHNDWAYLESDSKKISLINFNFISNRVVAYDIPDIVSSGEYNIYINNTKQNPIIYVQ